ncbi:MAG: hypothetical protein M1377_04650 [Deltaproteobacteria bacterium]|nr:hypothetical protein [Deltaproteobacteria bacterium]
MKIRMAERIHRNGLATLLLFMALFAGGVSTATEADHRIPVIRYGAGSEASVKIHREGERSTATPRVTATGDAMEKIADRIAGKVDVLKSRKVSRNIVPVPEGLTVRNVKGFLKALRASRKEKSDAPVVLAFPERRLGMADRPPHGAD